MSIEAISWAFKQPVKPAAKKFVLVALADNTDGHGICFPSYSHIEKKTSLSRRAIIQNIADLAKEGFIQKVTRSRANGSDTSNAYRLPIVEGSIEDHPLSCLFTIDQGVQEMHPPVQEMHPPVQEMHPPVQEMHPGGAGDAPLEPSLNRHITGREREPLSREAFLRGVNGGYQAGEFGDEFDHLTESEIANQAAECFDRWGDDLRGRNPVLILRSWLRKGQSLGTVRKAPKKSEAGDGALQESKRPEPENELQPQHERIKRCFSEAEFNAWIRPLVFTDGTIYAPTNFHKDYIRQNFSDRIEAALGTFFHYQTAEKELERA